MMITNPQNNAPKPKKQSLFGLLFNPQIGTSISPLREGNRIFIHLIASVFAIYKLIPKNYPGLGDTNARLSLFHIIGTAWQNLRFTRDGAPQVGLFFAITGIMLFSAIAAVLGLLSLFVGHAHAQTTSAFTAPSGDLAQSWMEYLFNNQPLPSIMGSAFPSSMGLQSSLTTALAFYSDAILIIAAIMLFYYLAFMVVETAHHGQVMGKKANQVWAPIRLVVAIGLLVPINGGLSSGQYIVVKVAEMGSGLATNAWNLFLTSLASYNPPAVPPNSPFVTQIASDLIMMEACKADYNARINTMAKSFPQLSSALITTIPKPNTTVNGHVGNKVSYTSQDLAGQDLCGWYFIPTAPPQSSNSDMAPAAYTAEANALTASLPQFRTDAQKGILQVMPVAYGGTGATTGITLDPSTMNDVIAYQKLVVSNLTALGSNVKGSATTVVNTIKPYGWVMAGAFFPTIERMQAEVSKAVTAGVPQTQAPLVSEHFQDGFWDKFAQGMADSQTDGAASMMTNSSEDEKNIRNEVGKDLALFQVLQSKSWAQNAADNAQCAAMMGLQDAPQGKGAGHWGIETVFGLIDKAASWNGVWKSGTGNPCGGAATGLSTFQVGIDLNGPDILSEIVALGHANLDTSFAMLGFAMAAKVSGLVVGLLKSFPFIGGLAKGALDGTAVIFETLGTLFFGCGFVLAYILPMFPFTRFLFAVLSWISGVIEAVIAIPLVALAHLNPEGDGIAGGAKGAYFFLFSIFLRPVLSIFGLIAGLLVFMVAASFLTYGYGFAVAASGATAYGHEVVSKVIYSFMYVAFMYACANNSFKLIDHIPRHAMDWMGQRGHTHADVGTADEMNKYETLAAGWAGSKLMSGIGNASGQLAQGASSGMATSRQRQQQLSDAGAAKQDAQ